MHNEEFSSRIRRGVVDFQAGESIPLITVDIEQYVAQCAKAGIQHLTFTSKDAFGNAYYNTKIGHKNIRLTQDLLGDVIKECKKYNLTVTAYYNVELDGHMASKNPDYRMCDKEGKPMSGCGYDLLCMNSPYRYYYISQLQEIADNYDISGFFLDFTYTYPCYCEYCQKLFNEKYGMAMPVKTGDDCNNPAKKMLNTFWRDARLNAMRETAKKIKQKHPGLFISWNRAGYYIINEPETDKYADYCSSEMHAPDYLNISFEAKYMRNLNRNFEFTCPSEINSWGDWTLMPSSQMKAVAAIAASNGAAIEFNNVPYFSGDLSSKSIMPIFDTITEACNWIKDREKWFIRTESIPDTALLYGVENKRMLDSSCLSFADSPDKPVFGLNRVLLDGNIHYDVINEEILRNRSDDFGLILLPDIAYLDPGTAEALKKYVQNGGKIITSGYTSLYDSNGHRKENFELSEVLGVDFIEPSIYSEEYIYDLIKVNKNIPDMPLLINNVKRMTLRVKAHEKAEILARFMDPALESKFFRHVYHQHAHPAEFTDNPSIVYNSYGKGAAIYIAAPIEACFLSTGNPWLRNLYLNLIDYIKPDRKIIVNGSPAIETILMRQDHRWIISLIHIQTGRETPCCFEQESFVKNIEVKVKGFPSKAFSVPEMKEISFTKDKSGISFCIPELGLHSMVVLENVVEKSDG